VEAHRFGASPFAPVAYHDPATSCHDHVPTFLEQFSHVLYSPCRAGEPRPQGVAELGGRRVGDVPGGVVLEHVRPQLLEERHGDRPPGELVAAAEEIRAALGEELGQAVRLAIPREEDVTLDPQAHRVFLRVRRRRLIRRAWVRWYSRM
jgi:hypothetical protein